MNLHKYQIGKIGQGVKTHIKVTERYSAMCGSYLSQRLNLSFHTLKQIKKLDNICGRCLSRATKYENKMAKWRTIK